MRIMKNNRILWMVALLGLFMASSASGQTEINASVIQEKIDATRILVLEEGERMHVDPSAVIWLEGNRISFAEIPEPGGTESYIMVEWAVGVSTTRPREITIKIEYL